MMGSCIPIIIRNVQYFRLKTTHSANQSIIFESGKNAPMGIADTPKRGETGLVAAAGSVVVVPHSDRFRSSSDRAIVAIWSAPPPRLPASDCCMCVRTRLGLSRLSAVGREASSPSSLRRRRRDVSCLGDRTSAFARPPDTLKHGGRK